MKRIDHFADIKHKAIYRRAFARLTLGELQFCIDFIAQNDHLGFHDFAQAANRAFMDKPKTKNFTAVIEFLNVANIKHQQHLVNGAR